MSYVGTRARPAAPLTHDVVQAHVCMHAATTLRVAELRRSLRTACATRPTTPSRRPSAPSWMPCPPSCTDFEDFNAQSRAAAAMQAALRTARTRAVHLFTRLCDVQRAVGASAARRSRAGCPRRARARERRRGHVGRARVGRRTSPSRQKTRVAARGGRETFFHAVRGAPGCDRTEEEEYIT